MASGIGSFTIPGASGVIGPAAKDTTTSVTYYGITVRETAGAVATVRVRGGGVIGGPIIETIALAANASLSIGYLPQGLSVPGGLYYEKVAGTVEGAVRIG